MKKLKNSGGFSLIEMLAALLILVLLVVGMDAGMNAATRAYATSMFEANSGSLTGILNTALGDILRYSEQVQKNPGTLEDFDGNHISKDDVGFVFTNYEYGVRSAYFHTHIHNDGTSSGTLQIKSLSDPRVMELVNTGSYAGLEITNFKITYHAPGDPADPTAPRGGYFDITYDIIDPQQDTRTRSVEFVVRRMNPDT